jgi:general secretion pathway protein F
MRFEVRALKPGVGVVSEAFEADDEAGALRLAGAQGLSVLSARRSRSVGVARQRFASRFQLVAFSQELVALLGAGLSLPETLDVMIEKESRPEARRVVQTIRERLMEGRSLSQAVDGLKQHFPPLYVATLRAAERSGDLCEALGRYIDYEVRLDALRKKVVSASIYPAALLIVGGLVVAFLLAYVVPRFAAIYAESGRELPWLSQLLLDWGQLQNAHGTALLVGVVVVGGLAALVLRHAGSVGGALVSRLPAVRDRVLIYHLARLYRTLGMLVRGGTPLVSALDMVAGLLPAPLRPRLAQAALRIREGAPMSDCMLAAGLTSPVAVRMLRVGENSGDLARMMDRIASFHDEELARWVDWFTKLFEPVLMALIGIVIGGIVVLMYMPIFDLAGSLQ